MLGEGSSAAQPLLARFGESARDILLTLKKRGEATADELARAVGITPSGVRQHLLSLRAAGLVAHRGVQEGPGRPRYVFCLTDRAEALFPKTYGQLATELMGDLEEEDPEMLQRIFQRQRRRRVQLARTRLAGKSLDERVAELARILDEDGYLADFEYRSDGTYLVIEHNCAIWDVAAKYPLACSTELEFLRQVLPEARIERVAHRVAGGYTCAYQIRTRRPLGGRKTR